MQFMFTYIRKPVRLTWVWRIFALPGRRVSTQPGEGEWAELDRASFLDAPAIQLIRGSLLGPTGLLFSRSHWGGKRPSREKWGSRWVLPISFSSCFCLSGSLAALTQEAEGRLSSASHPTAPSWTNTMLRKYLQTTFLPVLHTQKPQGQWFSRFRRSRECFSSPRV